MNDEPYAYELPFKGLPYEQWPIQRLTVDIIKKHYWNPITKTCKPIHFYGDIQELTDYNHIDLNDPAEISTMTFTGHLLTDNSIHHDWLSQSHPGPYTDNGSNGDTFFYLQLKSLDNFCVTIQEFDKMQIAWCGCNLLQPSSINQHIAKDLDTQRVINNYISSDALDGIDCWIKRQFPEHNVFSSPLAVTTPTKHIKLTKETEEVDSDDE